VAGDKLGVGICAEKVKEEINAREKSSSRRRSRKRRRRRAITFVIPLSLT